MNVFVVLLQMLVDQDQFHDLVLPQAVAQTFSVSLSNHLLVQLSDTVHLTLALALAPFGVTTSVHVVNVPLLSIVDLPITAGTATQDTYIVDRPVLGRHSTANTASVHSCDNKQISVGVQILLSQTCIFHRHIEKMRLQFA